jgi:uncharacterized membrane protein YphA (DoxX/SURF4 family)
MTVFVWISQGVLAFVFLASGFTKLTKSREELLPRMPYVEDLSPVEIRGIGILEVLGALGVVVPVATGILPRLTPIAAAGLTLVMVGAVLTHLRRGEFKYVPLNAVLFLLAAIVVVGYL